MLINKKKQPEQHRNVWSEGQIRVHEPCKRAKYSSLDFFMISGEHVESVNMSSSRARVVLKSLRQRLHIYIGHNHDAHTVGWPYILSSQTGFPKCLTYLCFGFVFLQSSYTEITCNLNYVIRLRKLSTCNFLLSTYSHTIAINYSLFSQIIFLNAYMTCR